MKTLLKVWLAILAGAAIGVLVTHDNGYVLLSFGVYTVEMSLALLLLGIAALFAMLYFLVRTLVHTFHLPRDLRDWKQRRGARMAQAAMTRGLLEMSEGNWRGAEKRLVKFADRSETPLLNYLAAARAAQLQGQHDRRDVYIRLAHEHMPSADVAVSLTQAELQLADHQLEQALATLRHLRSVAPKHTYVLRLLRRLYEQLGDWEQLRDLIPELRRRKVEDADELSRIELKTHRALLERVFLMRDRQRLNMAWNDVPRSLRSQPSLLGDYAGYLQEFGEDDQAEVLLRDALKGSWHPELLEIYGTLDVKEPGKRLSRLEKLLETHADDPTLLLTLARLSLRAQLWGKARGYLEACVGRNGPVEAYCELGRLLEHMQEPESALRVYRKALTGESAELPPIPLPENIGFSPVNRPRPMLDEGPVEPPPHGAAEPPPEPT